MATKKYDAAVKTGEYTDRNGDTKARWLNVGAVLQTDNGHCLLLDRTFNPAGIADPAGRGTVMVSLFAPRDSQPRGQQRATRDFQAPPPDDPDDAIPF